MNEITAADLIKRSFEWYANDVAVDDIPNNRRLTFGDVGEQTFLPANSLQDLVPGKGTRVATLMENRAEFVPIDFATTLIGDIRVGLNTGLTADEYEYILNDCGADVLFYTDKYRETVESIRGEVSVEHFIAIDLADPPDRTLNEITEAHTPDPPGVSVEGDDCDYIMHTSGTTEGGCSHSSESRCCDSKHAR